MCSPTLLTLPCPYPTLPCPTLFCFALAPLCLAPKKPNNDHSNVIISIITILSLSPLSSLSLSKFSNKAQNPTQLDQTLNATLQPKFSCKNRLFEPSDWYCTTALQSEWGCFRRVVALPLLPAVGVTVLAPYSRLNPIVILFEGYTSSKIQCLTSVS